MPCYNRFHSNETHDILQHPRHVYHKHHIKELHNEKKTNIEVKMQCFVWELQNTFWSKGSMLISWLCWFLWLKVMSHSIFKVWEKPIREWSKLIADQCIIWSISIGLIIFYLNLYMIFKRVYLKNNCQVSQFVSCYLNQ